MGYFVKNFTKLNRSTSLLSTFLILIFSCQALSQERRKDEFGELSPIDIALEVYEKDTTATAVVLYEQGHYYFDSVGDYIGIIKVVHKKIKIFDSKRFDFDILDVPLMTSRERRERLTRYAAITHNPTGKTHVTRDAVFFTSVPGIGRVFKMNFPNVQDGSILEYIYVIESPFLFNLDGWEFQGLLPKLYSEFISLIPGNYRYKSVRYGSHPFTIEESSVVAKCFNPMNSFMQCNQHIMVMVDVPAFEPEEYMLSYRNHLARLEFEPEKFLPLGYGNFKRFSTTWDDVDKLAKKGDLFGTQLNRKNYFKRRLPESILAIPDDLERAKAIYTFIQNHYTWDGHYFNSEGKLKNAFSEKTGSVPEINISLINALQAADLDAKLMLLSTRNNGLPTELYPVMTKFNYTLAVLQLGDKTYLLDATDKLAPFGVTPFHTLNVMGRVMDFKNGSFWMPIIPYGNNMHYANTQLTAQPEGSFHGEVKQVSSGYIGFGKRKAIEESGLDEYIKTEKNDQAHIEIDNFQVEVLADIEVPLRENYDIVLTPQTVGNKVILYPFPNKTYLDHNPFKKNERNYPMEFGFPFTNNYLVSIDLGNVYTVDQIPENRRLRLPGDDGECSVIYTVANNTINIRFTMKLANYRYQPDAYESLKELFSTVITMLKEEPIVLKRI